LCLFLYGQQLETIINQSRADNTVAPYVLHERPSRIVKTKSKSHWCQTLPDRLSKRFAAARKKIKKFSDMKSSEKPTFHEIRALGEWLYLEQGRSKEYVNLLMGHTTMAMTDHYTDRHIEYTECKAELTYQSL
jgi:integrase